jgi:hypothetical protein
MPISKPKLLPILNRHNRRFDHLCVDKIAAKPIWLPKPEVKAQKMLLAQLQPPQGCLP